MQATDVSKDTIRSVPVNKFTIGEMEKKLVMEALETGWISSEGPFIKQFEQDFARLCQRRHGVAVSNGSIALDLAVKALGLGPGDEVIMPSFTIISCSEAVVKAGALPRFVDADPLTWNMDVGAIERSITPRTKAIMVVHIYGLTVDMKAVQAITQRHGLLLIEDAAEAHGQTCQGRPCGSFGDISIFSFYPNKHVTTGEGGMILCDDDQLDAKCRSLRNLCFVPERRFVHYESGTNARMSNLLAGLGLGQLQSLNKTILAKKNLGAYYHLRLKNLPDVQLPLQRTEASENHYWVFGLVFGDRWPALAEIEKEFAKRGIGTRPFFYGLHQQPLYLKSGIASSERLPVTEKLSARGLYLPSGMATTKEDQDYVIDALYQMSKAMLYV